MSDLDEIIENGRVVGYVLYEEDSDTVCSCGHPLQESFRDNCNEGACAAHTIIATIMYGLISLYACIVAGRYHYFKAKRKAPETREVTILTTTLSICLLLFGPTRMLRYLLFAVGLEYTMTPYVNLFLFYIGSACALMALWLIAASWLKFYLATIKKENKKEILRKVDIAVYTACPVLFIIIIILGILNVFFDIFSVVVIFLTICILASAVIIAISMVALMRKLNTLGALRGDMKQLGRLVFVVAINLIVIVMCSFIGLADLDSTGDIVLSIIIRVCESFGFVLTAYWVFALAFSRSASSSRKRRTGDKSSGTSMGENNINSDT